MGEGAFGTAAPRHERNSCARGSTACGEKKNTNTQRNRVPNALRARSRQEINDSSSGRPRLEFYDLSSVPLLLFFFSLSLSAGPSHPHPHPPPLTLPLAKPPQLECVRVDGSVPINHLCTAERARARTHALLGSVQNLSAFMA